MGSYLTDQTTFKLKIFYKTAYNLSMLFLFLRIAFIFTMATSAFAAQWAKVTSDKAIIYADQEQLAPIGYIKKDKRVRVGEIVRNNGRVLPIVVSGKIAYIEVEDLDISYSHKILETPAQRLAKKATEKTFENRFALTYNGMASNFDTSQGEETVLFNGAGIRGYIINLKKRHTWRVGIDYITTSVKGYSLDIASLTTEYSKNIIQTGPYDFHLYGGLSLVPYSQFSRGTDFKENGYGGGISAGLEMIFKFNNVIALHVDGGYQYNKLFFQLNEAVQNDLGITTFEPALHGFKFSAALSFNYF